MPQFSPSAVKTAKAPITVKPSGLSCSAELYLVSNGAKVVTSGIKPFTSTGVRQDVTFSITMPDAEGTYPVYLDILSNSLLIGAYKAIEDAVISVPGIDLEEIAILGVNGKGFINVGIDADGLPYGELAEPIVVSWLGPITIAWQNKTIYFTEDDIIGLVMPMWYEPTWDAEYPCDSPPSWIGYNRVDLVCTHPEGCPPGTRIRTGIFEDTVAINSLFGHGYWCEGIYNARFKVDYNTPWGPYPSGMEFRIKNMVRCTGKGMK